MDWVEFLALGLGGVIIIVFGVLNAGFSKIDLQIDFARLLKLRLNSSKPGTR